MKLLLLAAAIAAMTLQAATAAAQFLDMEVYAVAYRPIPEGVTLQVRARGGSDLDMKAKQAAERSLTETGYVFSTDAALVLTVDTATEVENIETGAFGSTQMSQNEAEISFNVWSSQQSSILQGRRTGVTGRMQYRIEMTVYSRVNGQYLWRGTVTTATGPAGALTATGPMVDRLLESLGESEGVE
jgi:hypothetical protein